MDGTDIAIIAGVVVSWFVLLRWILPRFGVSTCMCGSCAVDPHTDTDKKADEKADEADEPTER